MIPAPVNLIPAKSMVDGTLLTGIKRADAVLIAGVALPQSAQQRSAERTRIIGVENILSFSLIFVKRIKFH